MADQPRSLEEIKASLQEPMMDLGNLKTAVSELCEHLIAQKAEIDANKAEIARRPTKGQMTAATMR